MNFRQGLLLKVLPYTYPHNYRAMRRDPFIQSGTTIWFAPADLLPAVVKHQHALYIHNVFPLISMDVAAGRFERVDIFFDKMLRYQQVSTGRTRLPVCRHEPSGWPMPCLLQRFCSWSILPSILWPCFILSMC